MRVVFKVADNPMETTTSPIKNGLDVIAVNVPRRVSSPSSDRKSDFLNIESKSGDFQSYLYPMRDVIELDSNSVEHEKRSEDYDRHTNEVIKQASIMTSRGERLVRTFNSVIVTFSILLLTKLWIKTII